MTARRQRGQKAEGLAADFLRQRGYAIVEMNWHCAQGELDIIARDGETLVFVEVRARTSTSTETAFASIGARKQARLLAAVQHYLSAHGLDEALWRVDAIGVALRGTATPLIEHVENALDW